MYNDEGNSEDYETKGGWNNLERIIQRKCLKVAEKRKIQRYWKR